VVSVIIVNYNSSSLLKKAINSVLNEHEDIEVIIVDNTATVEERTHLKELFGGVERIRLLFNKTNVGFARACNQGFSISTGNFIFLLNPDAHTVSPCLSILKNFLLTTPSAGAVSPQVYWDDDIKYLFPHYLFPSPFQELCSGLYRLSYTFGYLYSLYERRKNLKLWKSSSPLSVKNLSGGVVMLKRSAVEDAKGLFDERFFLFYEDADLFLRLRKAGYNLYIIPDAKAVHNYKHTNQKLHIMAQARYLYYEKHYGSNLLEKISARIPDHPAKNGCIIDHGIWNTPPSFLINSELQKGYLFEWSPNPLFIPSVGFFGKGEMFFLSEQIWNLLDNNVYYSRFTDPDKNILKFKVLYWRKEK
jgi:GT2 family glycosyltransferase